MKKSILYNFWSTSSSRLLNRFEKFINSPYFNANENSRKLFQIFQREFKKGLNGELDNLRIFSELYPKSQYDNQKLRLLYSDTYKQFKYFLCLEENPYYKQDNLHLANYYKDIGNEILYEKTLDKIESSLERQSFRNSNYFLTKYNIAKDKYDFHTNTKRLKLTPFDQIISSFDLAYYIEKLKQGCILRTSKNTELDIESEPDLFFVLKRVESNELLLQEYPVLAIYYLCFKALSNVEDNTNFNNFQRLLFSQIDLINKNEAKELLIMSINFCAKKINNREREYLKQVFEIYKIGIEKNILVSKKNISPFTFKNALSVAIEIENLKWAENFMEEYHQLLPAKQKDSVYKYCQAKILISKGDTENAKRILVHYYSEDILSYLSGKMLLIQLHFEEKEFDLLANLLDSMNVYINRKKKMSYHKSYYKDLIKYTKKLMNLPPFDQTARKALKKEIENPDVKLMKKEWFLEQIK